ncbi:RhuM family protein [Rikenella microfusus]
MGEVPNDDIVIYRTEDGTTKIEVSFSGETAWLTQAQIGELFQRERSVITKHIRNVFGEHELEEEGNVQNLHIAGSDKPVKLYSLDVIISVGYRVKSLRGTHFRRWATERLKEYMLKGFSMDDERLKRMGGGGYWRELLDRIRDIRSSEKVMYRQVLDLYATSVDYDPRAEESVRFFKIVQNKLHYAAHGHTAAEVIYERADADKPFMGLTHFPGDRPVKSDVTVAKNYLSAEELKVLNNLVSGYFDFAEVQAIRRRPMYMSDYIKQLDTVLAATGERLLSDAGKVSHEQAVEKAIGEYRKYQAKTLSPVEAAYLDSIRVLTARTSGKKNERE